MTAAIEFRGVTRAYGALRAVDNLSLQIQPGEFFAMLGPSGSGKTTCLRLIAGFERPDAGQVLLEGQDVSSIPPNERSVNTVFQDYALFPHLNVLDNVAYGPMVRGVAQANSATPGRGRCWPWCSWNPWRCGFRPSSPVASASAWPWPAH